VRFRRTQRRSSGINLTPLIDVVFLLLIFFMVSTTFTRETRLSVELPEADGQAATEELPRQLEVLVDREGSYAVNGDLLVNRKIETIMSALELASRADKSMPITIIADAEAPHRAVVSVMDAAGRLGFSQLSIATQEPQEHND
jgi:biopolymer transport protein ExbD